MNMKMMAAALAALMLAGPVRAEEAKAPTPQESIMTFFRHLRQTLSQSAVQSERKKGRRSASVAAVRGASQSSSLSDPNEPVIKGDVRSKKDKLAMAEDAEIAKGVDLILAGKTDEGVKALEEFKAKHPKSRNLEKVQQALDQAQALKAAAAAAPAAEAPKAETPKAEAVKDAAPAKK